ncbi:MAG TPA: DUF302 domain-containing protein [Bacteroidales bacterium]|nr:DUF302 domain-containing protein [Bacteroidales bacterium]
MEKVVLEKKSRFDFDKTVELLVAEAEKSGWTIPAVHDLRQSLAKSGKMVRSVKVIEMCKPEYSGQMLELNDERIISVMMPCRISVYEKDDGLAYIGLMNTSHITSGLPAVIARVMKQASGETLDMVTKIAGE